MIHHLSSILAARTGQRQVDAVLMAEKAAVGVDRAIGQVWSVLLANLRQDRGWAENYQAVLLVWRDLVPLVQQATAERLRRLALWGHRSAAKVLAQTLPLDYLRAGTRAQAYAAIGESHDHAIWGENRRLRLAGQGLCQVPTSDAVLLSGRPGDGDPTVSTMPLGEDEVREQGSRRAAAHGHRHRDRRQSARLRLAQAAAVPVALTEDEAGPEPAEPQPSADALRKLFEQLLFPPPSLDIVNAIVFGRTAGQSWPQRVASLSRLAPPEVLATIVANGFSQGLSQREIAAQLRPLVHNVRSRAARIARTEGLRVSHAVQQRCHDALGDLVIGNQVFAVLDQHTRSWHAARSGTIYYRNPGPGQKGPAQQPHPPQEAEDASERPAGTPATAPNCRCFLSPVLSAPEHVVNDPAKMAVFRDHAAKVIPDPQEMNQWFERADDRRRRIALGVKRLRAVEDLVGKDAVTYSHFVDPKTGGLLTTKQLQAEKPEKRAERLAANQALFARRAELIRQTSTFGFLHEAA